MVHGLRESRIHILHLFPGSGPRLWSGVWLGMLRGLLPLGYRITVLTGFRVGTFPEEESDEPDLMLEEFPCLAHPGDPAYRLRIRFQLRRRIQKENPDLIHVHHAELIAATGWLRRAFPDVGLIQSPAVDRDWISAREFRKILLRRAFRKAANHADRVTIRTEEDQEAFLASGLAMRYQTACVSPAAPQVIPKQGERREVLAELGIPEKRRVVGLFAPRENRATLRDLLISLNPLLLENPDFGLFLLVSREKILKARQMLQDFPTAGRIHETGDLGLWRRALPFLEVILISDDGLNGELAALYCQAAGVPFLFLKGPHVRMASGPIRTGRQSLAETVRAIADGRDSIPAGMKTSDMEESVGKIDQVYRDVLADRRVRTT